MGIQIAQLEQTFIRANLKKGARPPSLANLTIGAKDIKSESPKLSGKKETARSFSNVMRTLQKVMPGGNR